MDYVAILAASAWVPNVYFIYKEIQRRTLRSAVRIVSADHVKVSFNSYGPNFILKLAFMVENKNIVLSGIEAVVTNLENNKEKVFYVKSMEHNINESLTLGTSNLTTSYKKFDVMCLRLNTLLYDERVLYFYDKAFLNERISEEDKTNEKMLFLKEQEKEGNGVFNDDDFLKSVEMKNRINSINDSFFWEKGRYSIKLTFNIHSEVFDLIGDKYKFEMPSQDIKHIENNKEVVEKRFEAIVKKNDMPLWVPGADRKLDPS